MNTLEFIDFYLKVGFFLKFNQLIPFLFLVWLRIEWFWSSISFCTKNVLFEANKHKYENPTHTSHKHS